MFLDRGKGGFEQKKRLYFPRFMEIAVIRKKGEIGLAFFTIFLYNG